MSNSSNIKEMLDDYEKIKKELEELKKKTAETNLACIKIEKKKHSKLDAKVLFNLVSNVESYSKFIPWVKNSTI